ncbi:MAG: cob(I)yrinic acid a,c-diamide adenosyltransferase [Gemmatimonadetes bacterium]|nr:cob(I)yrinic acid a,c-diamide adenosyltransferase [Gemmatimonadota bacterium]
MTQDDERGSAQDRPRCRPAPREAADPRCSTGDRGPRHPNAPVPKQRTPGPYRVPPRERRNGLVILNTGNGKGKTTAALGTLLRARGRDMTVAMLQFLKTEGVKRGEHIAAERLGVEIVPMGAGFTWLSERIEEDRALARECWAQCREVLESGRYDIVIFDELTYPLAYGWLDHDEVLPVIRERPVGTHVVITGRMATEELIEFADLVTEMSEVKHPYKTRGIGAQPGLEL